MSDFCEQYDRLTHAPTHTHSHTHYPSHLRASHVMSLLLSFFLFLFYHIPNTEDTISIQMLWLNVKELLIVVSVTATALHTHFTRMKYWISWNFRKISYFIHKKVLVSLDNDFCGLNVSKTHIKKVKIQRNIRNCVDSEVFRVLVKFSPWKCRINTKWSNGWCFCCWVWWLEVHYLHRCTIRKPTMTPMNLVRFSMTNLWPSTVISTNLNNTIFAWAKKWRQFLFVEISLVFV